MTSSATIFDFRMRHTHGHFYFCQILFKLRYDIAIGSPVFGLEIHQNPSVISDFNNKAKEKNRCVSGHMAKKDRVGRSAKTFFLFNFFILQSMILV